MKTLARKKRIRPKIPKDPTQTATLFRQWAAEINRKFRKLKDAIKTEIVDKDIFGLQQGAFLVLERGKIVLQPRHFKYSTEQEILDGFMSWLFEMVDSEILEVTIREGAVITGHEGWQDKFVRAAYDKGVKKTGQTINSLYGANLVDGFAAGHTGLAFHLRGPVHAPKVASLYSRAFHELKGITEAMSQQIGRELAQGISLGKNPLDIARSLTKRVDAIGITRARLLARTETAFAHSMGTIYEAKHQEGVLGEEIKFQWLTAQDDRVRPEHQKRLGRVFTKEEAAELVGEPNCRCSLMPYIESVQGPIDSKTRIPLNADEWPRELIKDVDVIKKQ